MDATLDRVALSLSDIVTLVRIDTTNRSSNDLVRRFNIVALPTLILFRRGEVLWRECGIVSFERLSKTIRRHHAVTAY